MLELRVEARYQQSMAAVFAALLGELGQDRWLTSAMYDAAVVPRTGLRFGYRQAQRLYSGQVLECLRPVSIVFAESYRGPAGSISARQRWRVMPLDSATRLSGELRIETNRFARLQLRFWSAHFKSRARRTCARVAASLDASGPPHNDSIGHSNGSVSIVSTKTTSVKGRPTFR